jgi:large subunit ribosomal protein L6
MSRIGKQPIEIPAGVTVTVNDDDVCVKGPKGEGALRVPAGITVKVEGSEVIVERADESKEMRALHGMVRSRVANMVAGVTNGFQKVLELHGVGFRAAMQGTTLSMNLGGAKAFEYHVPDGVTVSVQDNVNITVEGVDSQQVGEVAAEIRDYYPPEPYKGKGVRYRDEYVRRKAGKSVSA